MNRWEFLPVNLRVLDRNCAVVGSGPLADRKQELLQKAGARVLRIRPEQALREWPEGLALVVIVGLPVEKARELTHWCQRENIPVNVAENPGISTLLFPSVVDRSPVLVAVSSSGDAPVLTRLVRDRLESSLPQALGRLASLAGRFRDRVKLTFKEVNQRRRFWEKTLDGRVAELVYAGQDQEAQQLVDDLLSVPEKTMKGGEVFLVGAGPGDPDLLTFKALRVMRQADVVLYDRLVSPEILGLVRRDAEMIYVGKARSDHALPQQSINQLLVEKALAGHRVLRLKGGDPFIFGRGGEEIDTLADHGIPFQVVPAITAASGCAAYSGIPLTHRDYAQSVRFITGHLKEERLDLDWSALVQPNETLVFYMGLISLPHISRELRAHGMPDDMPVAVVSRGTMPDQKVLTSTLAEVDEKVKESGIPGPTIIIIGRVVELRGRLNWLGEP